MIVQIVDKQFCERDDPYVRDDCMETSLKIPTDCLTFLFVENNKRIYIFHKKLPCKKRHTQTSKGNSQNTFLCLVLMFADVNTF